MGMTGIYVRHSEVEDSLKRAVGKQFHRELELLEEGSAEERELIRA